MIVFCVLLFAVGLVALPLVWKFVFLLIVIVVGGYLLSKALEQKPDLETGVIDFGPNAIAWQDIGKEEINIALQDIAEINIWSDFYPGYILPEHNARRSNGQMKITLTLKSNAKYTKQCLVSDSLHYKTTVNVLKAWYRLGVPIKESVGFSKYKGFLMDQQSSYSFAELQAMKAELGIS